MNATLLFSHGNGFPGATYEQLFRQWRARGLSVEAVDRFGHDPRHPVSSNWPHLRDELIERAQPLARSRTDRPLVLVGHSLGGLLSLMAACWKPGLADAIVLLDSPVITGWRAHSLHMAKLSGLIHRVSPGRVSQRRRHLWPSREAVREHFQSKGAFSRWDPRALEDYVTAGFEARDGQWTLRFDREVETRIYNALPHTLGTLLRRHPLRCPMGFVAGRQSREMQQGGTQTARRLAGEHFHWIEGSHLFPMEHPDQTADQVVAILQDLHIGQPPII